MSNFTRNRFERGAVALTAAIAVGLGATACSGEKPAPAASTSDVQPSAAPQTGEGSGSHEVTTTLDANLSPEKILAMRDPVEITKAFQIPASSISSDREYVNAYIARINAVNNMLTTQTARNMMTVDVYGREEMNALGEQYAVPAYKGFTDLDTQPDGKNAGYFGIVASKAASYGLPAYEVVSSVSGEVVVTANASGGKDYTFTVRTKDNLKPGNMVEEPYAAENQLTLVNVHQTADGNLQPQSSISQKR